MGRREEIQVPWDSPGRKKVESSTTGVEREKPRNEQHEISVRVHNQGLESEDGEEDGPVVAVSLGMAPGFCWAAILPSRFGGAANFLVAAHVWASKNDLESNVELEVVGCVMVVGREKDESKGEETLGNRNLGIPSVGTAKHCRPEPCAPKPEAAFEPEPGAVQLPARR